MFVKAPQTEQTNGVATHTQRVAQADDRVGGSTAMNCGNPETLIVAASGIPHEALPSDSNQAQQAAAADRLRLAEADFERADRMYRRAAAQAQSGFGTELAVESALRQRDTAQYLLHRTLCDLAP